MRYYGTPPPDYAPIAPADDRQTRCAPADSEPPLRCDTPLDYGVALAQLLALAFWGVAIYALASGDGVSLREACGSDLWQLVLLHVLLGVPLACGAWFLYKFRAALVVPCILALVCILHTGLLAVTAPLAHAALSDAACRAAMAQASAGKNDPLLGNVAVVCVLIDSAFALCVLGLAGGAALCRAG